MLKTTATSYLDSVVVQIKTILFDYCGGCKGAAQPARRGDSQAGYRPFVLKRNRNPGKAYEFFQRKP